MIAMEFLFFYKKDNNLELVKFEIWSSTGCISIFDAPKPKGLVFMG